MSMQTKPDLVEVQRRWEHFWNGALYRRPPVLVCVPRRGVAPDEVPALGRNRYYDAVHGRWKERMALIDRWLEKVCFPGDMIPSITPNFGPDQWAAFFGAELKFADGDPSTNWVDPVIADWDTAPPLRFDPQNTLLQQMLAYARELARHGEGRYLVGQIDAHSNADALSALRGPERFMLDLYDAPERIDEAMRVLRASYRPVHEALAAAGGMGGERGFAASGFWHAQPFQVVQSDVICMLGQEPFRRWVLPALEEEAASHDRFYFHLDGPGALRHLDDILTLPGYWVLQWQPGAGQKPNWQWPEILEKAQAAGKAVLVFGKGLDKETVKPLQRRLDPARVVYALDGHDEDEALEFMRAVEET